MKEQASPAILLFGRQAAHEALHKRWLRKGKGYRNRLIAKALLSHTQTVLHRVGYPVYHFDDQHQSGTTFGERITHAFRSVFERGHPYVICVGSDCPQLSELDWGLVKDAVDRGQTVLGPDLRGGAYLIGIPAKCFDSVAFEQLPWQSSRLFTGLSLTFCSEALVLPAFRDMNGAEDLSAYAALQKANPMLRLLLLTCMGTVSHSPSVVGLSYRGLPAGGISLLRAPPLS